ncbi:venom toxin OcyC11-like [Eriocheir sinensis]|uniref:Single VWC domain protein n=1 Tax=Eriocheir sinensis TaxID=95602 RepID=A0A173DQD6_ERISI|nr:venom toxin OcyC11-like [Eriocheir sinensis]ANG56305.1 single VWC domain protein [Eriocheir sinensis]
MEMRVSRAVVLAKAVLISLVFISATRPADAAVSMEFVGDPEHPDTCLIEEKGIRVKDGHTWALPGCVEAQCSGYGEDMYIDYYSCPSMQVSPPCKILPAPSLPYPACCGKVFCP